jgi:putative oxidoreductase
MKKLLTVNENANGVDLALLITRVGIALLMLTHGLPKMGMLLSGEPVQFPGLFGLSASTSLGLAVFAEVICSVLILAGFATRLAVIPLAITMLVALFAIHAADPFAKQEPALHYLLVYVALFLTGSGKYSIDYLLQKRSLTEDGGRTGNNPVLSVQK